MTDLSKEIFVALNSMDELAQEGESSTLVSFSELFRYAVDPGYQPTAPLQDALQTNFSLRRDLKRLISKNSLVTLPMAAAASSGDILHREADGYEITLKPSRADKNHLYLLIVSEIREEIPKMLFVVDENGTPLRHIIADYQDGHYQTLLNADSKLVKALKNHASLVILRK